MEKVKDYKNKWQKEKWRRHIVQIRHITILLKSLISQHYAEPQKCIWVNLSFRYYIELLSAWTSWSDISQEEKYRLSTVLWIQKPLKVKLFLSSLTLLSL